MSSASAPINESFGRSAGDDVIRTLQSLFELACEPGEFVAHANADHFVLLLRNGKTRAEQLAALTAARLRANETLPFSDRIVCGYGVFELTDAHRGHRHSGQQQRRSF